MIAAPPSPSIDTRWTCCVEVLTGSAVWAIQAVVTELDEAIRELRAAVFHLQPEPDDVAPGR